MSYSKGLRCPESCISINNNLCRKSVALLELPIKFDERFKFISVPNFIPDFNLLSCELDSFTIKLLY